MFGHLFAAALFLTTQNAPAPDLCAGDAASRWQNVAEAEQAYGDRSITVVNAALAGDESALASLVASHAHFGADVADSGFGPGRMTGPAAAIEFFRGLAPTDYLIMAQYAAMVSSRPCEGASAEVLLRGPDWSAVLRFRYEQGMLVEVSGRLISVTQGQLHRPHD
jgi:hypothetical protein